MIALLHEIKEKDANSKLLDDESLHWLASNAWNLGLRTAKALQFLATSKIMSSSYELFSMIKDDDKVGILKTRCLIVSAGARIEAALLSELVDTLKPLKIALLRLISTSFYCRNPTSKSKEPAKPILP